MGLLSLLGTIMAETTNALVVDMTGTYTPVLLFIGLTAAPAEATLAFTHNGSRFRRASP